MTQKQKSVRNAVAKAVLKFMILRSKNPELKNEKLAEMIEACRQNNLTRMNIVCTMGNYRVPQEIYEKAKEYVLFHFHYENDTANKVRKVKSGEIEIKKPASTTVNSLPSKKQVLAIVNSILKK